MLDILLQEIGIGIPDARDFLRVCVRLLLAVIAGGVIGMQREHSGKAAGLRTHMLVALGAAVFVIAPIEMGMRNAALSRVIQGLVTGIGFLGTGAILKREEKGEVEGLTTAAGIWITAAMGLAVGLGRFGLAFASMVFTFPVLTVIRRTERWLNRNIPDADKNV